MMMIKALTLKTLSYCSENFRANRRKERKIATRRVAEVAEKRYGIHVSIMDTDNERTKVSILPTVAEISFNFAATN